MIGIGEKAPDFTLRDQHGGEVSLTSFFGRPVVLYFYPKDGTSGCTAQACTFRDQMAEFAALDARVIGVSGDSVRSHAEFAKRNGLTFTLLSDEDGSVRARYGARKTFGLIAGRVTFVIDAEGVVRHVFDSQLRARRHVEEARLALVRLATSTRPG